MTKTTTFKTGDRVVLIADNYNPQLKAGAVGTVLEESRSPYVSWDGFTSGHHGFTSNSHRVDVWSVSEENLSPIKPRKTKPKAANTKIAKLRHHFLSGKSLTQLEALGLYGAFRLAARVHDLKAEGMKIETRMKEDPNGNPYAEYQIRSKWVKA